MEKSEGFEIAVGRGGGEGARGIDDAPFPADADARIAAGEGAGLLHFVREDKRFPAGRVEVDPAAAGARREEAAPFGADFPVERAVSSVPSPATSAQPPSRFPAKKPPPRGCSSS